MALLVMIMRKMIQNRWLVGSLFAGIAISVALVSSMPIYSRAVLGRMLVKDLERQQSDSNQYPGSVYSYMRFTDETPEEVQQMFRHMDGYMRKEAWEASGLPVGQLAAELFSRPLGMRRADAPDSVAEQSMQRVTIKSLENLEQHVAVKDGRLPAAQPVDGVYEVMVTERGLNHYRTVLDTVFLVEDDRLAEPILLKLVGVVEKGAEDDVYFRTGDLGDLSASFIMPYAAAGPLFMKDGGVPAGEAAWHLVIDYSRMDFSSIRDYADICQSIKRELNKQVFIHQMGIEARALDTLGKYGERVEQLGTLMWSLHVPILIMLVFYMFMVANLIAGRQKNEIAVLRSRGAARWQIMAMYLAEGTVLCAAAFAIGPLLGMALTEVLGASSGFLEFVQRVRLPVRITREAYLYAAIASAACLVIITVPVMATAGVTIVSHKQQMARWVKTPFWHKAGLDAAALLLSFYGLYSFRRRLENLQALGLGADDLAIDPLHFIVPALFIVGAGLLLLRLYPLLLKLIYWIGRRWWPPSLYAALLQAGRSSGQYQFLMIFLIMTMATGVFSASAARTINANTEDRIQYGNGADMVLTVNWASDAAASAVPDEAGAGRVHYLEPPFEPFLQLPGVESGAKVFVKEKADFFIHDESGSAMLVGIDTDDFGRTAWFRNGLLDHHFFAYLNLLASDTRAVLISQTLAEQKKAQPGDTIWIGWPEAAQQPFTVYGILRYFPAFNPNPTAGGGSGNAPMLIVGHLERIQTQLALEPYKVWLKLGEQAAISQLYDHIRDNGLAVSGIANTREQLARAKNDPFLLALNGVLTLGFVLSILISFIGFLLYWVLSLKGRTLQNGILRAMGLSMRQLLAMLAVEQLLTSGIAVGLGIIIGHAASLLYVPNFQIAFHPASLVPPFMVQLHAGDLLRIYTLVGIMLAAGLVILGCMLSRLRIHQALKLGED